MLRGPTGPADMAFVNALVQPLYFSHRAGKWRSGGHAR